MSRSPRCVNFTLNRKWMRAGYAGKRRSLLFGGCAVIITRPLTRPNDHYKDETPDQCWLNVGPAL